MRTVAAVRTLVAVAAFAAFGTFTLPDAAAQGTGAITGQVTDSATGAPIAYASVIAVNASGGIGGTTRTTAEGSFRISGLAAGAYTVQIQAIGFSPQNVLNVQVSTGAANLTIALARARVLEQVVVTATRGATAEKLIESPASVSVVPTEAIETRPSLTTTDHLKSTPGVDISQAGLVQSNVVTRGFNNIFSGSLLTLQDYRFAGVPSLRVNVPFLFSGTNEDIERIEVLLGPASALYGPNSANGVMHVITKSPFASLGSTITLDGGSQDVIRLSGRHAMTLGSTVGVKVSAEYLKATDFKYDDPGEPNTFPDRAPPGRAGTPNARDFGIARATGEARLDWRGNDGAEAVTTFGATRILSGIEMTGANGAVQVENWTSMNVQQRYRRGRFFAQVFGNFSNTGTKDTLSLDGTYLLRTGQPIVDQSRVFAAQAQYGFSAGGSTFTYGADYIFTNPRTGNTINGRNEDKDNVTEYGAYIQGTTPLTPRWDFVSALRADKHSVIEGAQISPRAALVFKPTPNHNVRATYNRAFQTPANFSYFLDLVQLRNAGGSGFDVRAVGNNGGREFDRSCTGAGFGNFCMRSIYTGDDAVPASAAAAFPTLVNVNAPSAQALIQAGLAGHPQLGPMAPTLAAAIVNGLKGATPGTGDLATRVAYLVNPTANLAPEDITDIGALKASFNNSFEIGYKGMLGNRGRLSVDAWYQERGDVSPPAGVATPSVFFDPTSVGGYLATNIVSTLTPIFMSPQGGNMPQQQAVATATAIAQQVAPQLTAVLAQAPLGTITFADETRPDVLFTYFSLNRTIDLFGIDLGYDFELNRNLVLAGTYSWQSRHTFDNVVFSRLEGGNGLPYMSNSPKHKASLSTRYTTDDRQWSGELRGRYTDAFPVNSGLFASGIDFTDPNGGGTYQYPSVPTTLTLDIGATWRPMIEGHDLAISLNVTNLLDSQKPTFAGTAPLGRLILSRISYRF